MMKIESLGNKYNKYALSDYCWWILYYQVRFHSVMVGIDEKTLPYIFLKKFSQNSIDIL